MNTVVLATRRTANLPCIFHPSPAGTNVRHVRFGTRRDFPRRLTSTLSHLLAKFAWTAPRIAALIILGLSAPAQCEDDMQTRYDLVSEQARIGPARFTASDYKPARIRHIVMFRYKEGVSQAQREDVRDRFKALAQAARRDGARYIVSIETGAQISGEGLGLGFEDAFIVTFASEGDRNYYVGTPLVTNPRFFDPIHQSFKEYVGRFLADKGVLVFDFAMRQ